MSNLKYFLAGVLIMAITSCMQKDSELFLFVGSYADATDPVSYTHLTLPTN